MQKQRLAILKLSNGRFKKVKLAEGVSIMSIKIIKKSKAGRPRIDLSPAEVLNLRALKKGQDYITVRDWVHGTLYLKVREIATQLDRKFRIYNTRNERVMHITRTR